MPRCRTHNVFVIFSEDDYYLNFINSLDLLCQLVVLLDDFCHSLLVLRKLHLDNCNHSRSNHRLAWLWVSAVALAWDVFPSSSVSSVYLAWGDLRACWGWTSVETLPHRPGLRSSSRVWWTVWSHCSTRPHQGWWRAVSFPLLSSSSVRDCNNIHILKYINNQSRHYSPL